MTGQIYLLNDKSELVAMHESPYDSEALLQELLAKHSELLAGDQMDTNDPRRWLFVTREMGVRGNEKGSERWSLDHLFLDQDAVPTLVEVKRSSDTRLRREVVGQMLDYAANAVAYWPIEEIRAKFERQCEVHDKNPEEELADFLAEDRDIVDFWQQVKTNLQAGRIRMVFVADTIPPELRRVVEFLNEQMDPGEVIAVEIKQFTGEGMNTMVPRVVGQTELARQKKVGGRQSREPITEAEFLADFLDRPQAEQEVARSLITWARQQGLRDVFKKGYRGSAFIPTVERQGQAIQLVEVQQRGMVSLPMRQLKNHAPFDESTKREQLHDRIKGLPGLRLTEAGMEGFPKFLVKSLTDKRRLNNFIDTLSWMVEEIRKM